ncbi:bifunctional 4-hydroxy-2-oxoglutarate aldolase/2-dehydro-3-deoxy-phosphogluconate aldolase [Pseudonocardia alni]|uniref:bifunctional 4-hydroxy-2-oxoglutarate aldolase/2-dehydro-3-deoxy-phosphogluconate aldolase n=1 Tax=Pseudonocardia alni TaxID=33907 RepID=UPI0033FB72DE
MLRKLDVLNAVDRTGTILIVRLDDPEEALAVARAAVAGGVRVLEITYSVPGALDVVRTLSREFAGDGVAVGVGTVLDEAAAFAAVQAGARLLVSPHLSPGMIRAAQRYGAVSVSGAYTPTEVVATLEAGADLVKLFPTENAGPDYARALLAPLPQASLVPAGGVSTGNVKDWFAAGVHAVGVGSAVTKAARPDGDMSRVTAAAADFLAAVADARA